MGHIPDSPMGKMYGEHINFILTKNVQGLLNQYTDDCVLISTLNDDKQKPLYVRGKKELEAFFRSRIFSLEKMDIDLTQWAEDKNVLMMVEHIKTTGTDGKHSEVHFYDNWWLRDGKIAIHFAGTVRYPDGVYADQMAHKGEPPDTPLGRLYHEHIQFILAKNVEGVVNQYAPDALQIATLTPDRSPRFIRGREEIRAFQTANFMGLKSLTSKIDQWAEIKNGLMIVESIHFWGVDGSEADMSFYDNWVLNDKGQIIMHYAGVIRYPDGTYA